MKQCTNSRRGLLSFITLLVAMSCFCQQPVKEFGENVFTADEYKILRKEVGVHKSIPAYFEKQILIALCFFPELSGTWIEFRVKHTRTPLASRPSWLSVLLKNDNRKYIITISDSTMPALMPILLKEMNFNAQVGVIGHELSHVADFSAKKSFGLLRIGAGNLSQKFLDRFEYRTDSIAIAHGLGFQLLSWSIFVRKALHHENWEGADNVADTAMKRERYMNPGTVRRRIRSNAIYKDVR